MRRNRLPQAWAAFFAPLAAALAFVMLGHADRCWADYLFEQQPVTGYGIDPMTGERDWTDGTVSYDDTGDTILMGALDSIGTLSNHLVGETGTDTSIIGSIGPSSGNLDDDGNEMFTVNSLVSLYTGATFTISGAPSEFVVVNVAAGNVGIGLSGAVDLAGIDTDQARFDNFDGGVSIHSGYVSSSGTSLDSTGASSVTDSRRCPASLLQFPTATPRSSKREPTILGLLPAWL